MYMYQFEAQNLTEADKPSPSFLPLREVKSLINDMYVIIN